MRTFIYPTILFFLILSQEVVAEECDAPEAPEQVRIYYANGMNNKPEDIDRGKDKLASLIGSSSSRSFGKSENTKEPFFRQLLEVFGQRESEPSKFWEWLADLNIAPQWFKDAFSRYTSTVSNVSYALDAELRVMVAEYLQDLNSGKKVVVVAHSQGNFYANTAYQYIRDNYYKYRNSIGIVAVGTPAGRVQDGGAHTTNSKDTIVNLVRIRYSVLPPNMTYDDPNDHINHNFITTYITAAGSKIRSDVYNTINRLTLPQKHVDCENANDVAVDVDVRSVSNITNTSAKLNGYVRSGKNIDTWFLWNTKVPSACTNSDDSRDGVGTFKTGDNVHYNKSSGLVPGTTYYVRFCGKGTNNRTNDGGYVSFKTTGTTQTDVDTLSVSNIGTTSATFNGYIRSGSSIDSWWTRNSSSIPSCFGAHGNGLDGVGSGDTGEYKDYRWGGLRSNTRYYYRFCGKGKDGINEGAYKSFVTKNDNTDLTTRNARICVTDVNSILDDYYNIYLNGSYVGAVRNIVGGSTCFNKTFRSGNNTVFLDLVQTNGLSTYLELNINNGEYVQYFFGSTDHTYTVTAP